MSAHYVASVKHPNSTTSRHIGYFSMAFEAYFSSTQRKFKANTNTKKKIPLGKPKLFYIKLAYRRRFMVYVTYV